MPSQSPYLQFDVTFLQLVGVCLKPNVGFLVVRWGGLELSVEQGIHQSVEQRPFYSEICWGRAQRILRWFSDSSLSNAEQVEREAAHDGLVDQLIGQRVEADMARERQHSHARRPRRRGCGSVRHGCRRLKTFNVFRSQNLLLIVKDVANVTTNSKVISKAIPVKTDSI